MQEEGDEYYGKERKRGEKWVYYGWTEGFELGSFMDTQRVSDWVLMSQTFPKGTRG